MLINHRKQSNRTISVLRRIANPRNRVAVAWTKWNKMLIWEKDETTNKKKKKCFSTKTDDSCFYNARQIISRKISRKFDECDKVLSPGVLHIKQIYRFNYTFSFLLSRRLCSFFFSCLFFFIKWRNNKDFAHAYLMHL